MTNRKQTPDILADLLVGDPETAASEVLDRPIPASASALPPRRTKVAATAPDSQTGRPPTPRLQRTKPVAAPKAAKTVAALAPENTVRWEHRVVSFQEHKGWQLRFVDGVEIPNWMAAPDLPETLAQMALEGWQVAAACSGQAMFGVLDKYQVFFKRPR